MKIFSRKRLVLSNNLLATITSGSVMVLFNLNIFWSHSFFVNETFKNGKVSMKKNKKKKKKNKTKKKKKKKKKKNERRRRMILSDKNQITTKSFIICYMLYHIYLISFQILFLTDRYNQKSFFLVPSK